MKVIALPSSPHYGFLMHVFESYVGGGIPTGELRIAAEVHELLAGARDLDLAGANLGSAKLTDAGPGGLALELTPDASV